jgi:hypothetical protein
MILCEVGDVAQKQFGKTSKDLREALYAYGYKSYWLGKTRRELSHHYEIRGLENILFLK